MLSDITNREKNSFIILIVSCLLIYLVGWQIPIMEIDAAQYANISREMISRGNLLQIYDLGKDYLDKPPMLFWLSSLSMRIFGVHDWAYRLPSFLFSIISIYSTYRLGALYYSRRIAFLGGLVLASCQAMFLINHDVRTDTMLMGWVIASVWQLAAWYQNLKWRNLIFASVALAGGLMTKGPIAFMVPVFAFLPHFILRRAFNQFFRWQYLLILGIVAVLLIPMSLGLYDQFDLHPEKLMYGQKGTSGIRFFFWTQSFGRITGESVWHENDSFFFLFQNMLWGFLPWIIFFVIGLVFEYILIIKNGFTIKESEEWITSGGFLLTYCALAVSRYQLPHYIYVVFPFAAIITAKQINRFISEPSWARYEKGITIIHMIVFSLLILAVFLLLYLPFPPVNWLIIVLAIFILVSLIYLLVRGMPDLPALIVMPVFCILFINLFLNTWFYPNLLKYQLGIGASNAIKGYNIPKERLFVYGIPDERSLFFYSDYNFKQLSSPIKLNRGDYLLVTGKALDTVKLDSCAVIYSGESFHVTQLSLPFLNPKTRNRETSAYYILQKK